MKPSAHFRQHHDLEAPRVDATAFRPTWRVRTRLDRLRDQGAISLGEWHAAMIYRAAWIAALGGTLKSSAALVYGPSCRRAGDYPTVRRLDALAALRAARSCVGPVAVRLLEACVVDDRSWHDLARQHRVNHQTARIWTVIAIKMLSACRETKS